MAEDDAGAAAIRLDRVSKAFGAFRVLDDVSLAIPRGEATVVLGRSDGARRPAATIARAKFPLAARSARRAQPRASAGSRSARRRAHGDPNAVAIRPGCRRWNSRCDQDVPGQEIEASRRPQGPITAVPSTPRRPRPHAENAPD